jgi:hypothetical protein
MLFFRPEDVEFVANGEGQAASVESKLFLGSSSRLYLAMETDGQVTRFYADVSSKQATPLVPGETVRVRLPSEHARVFAPGR